MNEKVSLRYPVAKDAEDFYRILNHGNFDHYHATIPTSVEMEEQWILRREYKRENNLEYNYVIEFDNKVVGGCEIRIDQENSHIGELGYFIDRNYWGKGIATQVVKLLEKIAFESLNLYRVEIRMDTNNLASQKIAIKNNYKEEGIIRSAVYFNDKYYDNYLYSKLKAEY